MFLKKVIDEACQLRRYLTSIFYSDIASSGVAVVIEVVSLVAITLLAFMFAPDFFSLLDHKVGIVMLFANIIYFMWLFGMCVLVLSLYVVIIINLVEDIVFCFNYYKNIIKKILKKEIK